MARKTIGQRVREIVGHAFGSDVMEYQLEKAVKEARDAAQTANQTTSFFYDPLSLFMGREWLLRSGNTLTFNDLRAMAKNPVISSIVNTRLNQVASFCTPSSGLVGYGFKVNRQDGRTEQDPKEKEVTAFLATAGFPGYGDNSLEDFVRRFVRDSLILDQANAEVVMRNNGLPAYFVTVDAATVRRLKGSLKYFPQKDEPVYCQVLNEMVVTQYTSDQMIFGIRNPQTDIRANGYGSSELETLINTVTILTNAERYNAQSLSQGGTKKGVMVLKGDFDPKVTDAFKREFKEAVSNASQVWKPPVLTIGSEASVDWVELDRSNKDMEYSQLFEFIVKLATSVYQIAPEEINWRIGAAGAKVNFESRSGDTLGFSQDKGLRPLLHFVASELNSKIVTKFDPDLRVEFTGLDTGESEFLQEKVKAATTIKTLNEVREDVGLKPIIGGDIVLNDIYLKGLELAQSNANGGDPEANAEKEKEAANKEQIEKEKMQKSVETDWEF